MPDSILAVLIAGEEKTLDDLPFPPSYPAYANIIAAKDGHLWVREFTRYVDTDSTDDRWSIFHSDGHWLGDVRLPRRFTLYGATAEQIFGIQEDEMGLQFIRAFRLRKGGI